MSIFNKINKILSTKLTPLKADLMRLNAIQSGLGDEALKYVSKGKSETVLASLNHHAAEGVLDVCQNYSHKEETRARRDYLLVLAKKDLDSLKRYVDVLTTLQNPFPSSASGSDKCSGTVRVFFSEYFSAMNRFRYDISEQKSKILDVDTVLDVARKLGGG